MSTGQSWNGVDWDTFLQYVQDVEIKLFNVPIALWQMPGASMQIQGAMFSGVLSSTYPDWQFSNTALNNNMSNVASALNYPTTAIDPTYYFTQNSQAGYLDKYMRLTSSSQ